MNLLKYRDTQDYREILRLFQKSSEQKDDNYLWQNLDGKRILHPISHLEIDFVGREVVVYLDRPLDVQSNNIIYFKLAINDTIFKLEHFFIQQDCLTFKFPQTLKTWELRSHQRFTLEESEEYSAVLSLNGQREASQQLKVRLHDFSATGLGLSISELNKQILEENKTLWLHSINGQQIPQALSGKVMYFTKETAGRRYRFGLQFQKNLPLEVLKSIIS